MNQEPGPCDSCGAPWKSEHAPECPNAPPKSSRKKHAKDSPTKKSKGRDDETITKKSRRKKPEEKPEEDFDPLTVQLASLEEFSTTFVRKKRTPKSSCPNDDPVPVLLRVVECNDEGKPWKRPRTTEPPHPQKVKLSPSITYADRGVFIGVRAEVGWEHEAKGDEPSLAGLSVVFEAIGDVKGHFANKKRTITATTDEKGCAHAIFCLRRALPEQGELQLTGTLDKTTKEIGPFVVRIPDVEVVELVEVNAKEADVGMSTRDQLSDLRTQYVEWPSEDGLDRGRKLRVKAKLAWRKGVKDAGSIEGRQVSFFTDCEPYDSVTFGEEENLVLRAPVGDDGWTAIADVYLTPKLTSEVLTVCATEEETIQTRSYVKMEYLIDDAPVPKVEVVEVEMVRPDGQSYEPRVVLGSDERRQYVNIDEVPKGDEARPEYGPKVYLKARVEAIGKHAKLRHAVEGQYVYACDVESKYEISTDRHYRPTPLQKPKRVAVGKNGWSEVLTIQFGTFGGDTYRMAVTTDGSMGKDNLHHIGTFVVWRKLWYQISAMKNWKLIGEGKVRAFEMDGVVAAYTKAFIELEPEGPVVPLAYQSMLYSDARMRDYAKEHYVASKSPFKLHVIVVEQIDATEVEELEIEIKKPVYTRSWKREMPQTGWVVGIQYKKKDKWLDLAKGCVTCPKKKLTIDLTDTGIDLPVVVKVRLQVFSGHAAGLTRDYPHVFINKPTDPSASPRSDDSATEIVAHEAGHALSLVPQDAKNYDPEHTAGGHCKDERCIMFWSLAKATLKGTFCKDCQGHLAEVDVAARKVSFKRNLPDYT